MYNEKYGFARSISNENFHTGILYAVKHMWFCSNSEMKNIKISLMVKMFGTLS